jgi:two-component system, NtrC family, sensor kinase
MLSLIETVDRHPPASRVAAGGQGSDRDGPTLSAQAPLIAVVDDNADIVDAVSEALRYRHYRVAGFRDAVVALRELELGETPALIVLDLMMPRMDGWSFRVKQRASARLREVPVIVMSASGSAQAEAIDANAYLRKPLSMERFCTIVEQTLASDQRRRLLAHSAEIERLRALGFLSASIAHEINNPLTYISGNLDLALLGCQRLLSSRDLASSVAGLEKSLAAARVGTDQVAQIVSGLLVFARSEGDNQQATADVGRSIEGAMKLARSYVTARAGLECRCPTLPPVVGQQGKLAQVFLNLIMNAAQAISPGHVERNRICISARQDGLAVIVEVSDTGCGIPTRHLERVFDAFFTTKPAGEGTGIGLSFCKDVVEHAGGAINVRSEEGKGTTIVVRLRVAPS